MAQVFSCKFFEILKNTFLHRIHRTPLVGCFCTDNIFVFFESPESAHSFREYMSSKYQNITFIVKPQNIGSRQSLDVKIYRKKANLSLVFPERHHLVEFSPVMKVSFRLTKRRDFYTHYFIEIPVYVLISRYFIWKSII